MRSRLHRFARFVCDVAALFAGLTTTIAIKLIFPNAFSWRWIGVGLIVWFVAAIIMTAWLFEELTRHIEQ
jgi:Na+/melibiose symporter-like transporter